MMRQAVTLVIVALLAAGGMYIATRPQPPKLPTSATVIQNVREVARLCAEAYLQMREGLGFPLVQK